MRTILAVDQARILDGAQPVRLRGVNLGGWLMMEGYILHSPNNAEHAFKRHFAKMLGPRALQEFKREFQDRFIRADDLVRIAEMGFNCVRVPFNYRLLEPRPYQYDRAGVARLDEVIRWAKQSRVWVILDLHAACGSQNRDWHSDSEGEARLWTNRRYQNRTIALWEFLADRYRQEPAVAGYNFLNEPVTEDISALNRFYRELIQAIRAVDKKHIFFVEGNLWSTDLECLDLPDDPLLSYSIHMYEPLEFTFNFIPQLAYPTKGPCAFNRGAIQKLVRQRIKRALLERRPVLVGEFGVNARDGLYGETQWLHDVLEAYERFGLHWTYWTYKAVKNGIFPDGIYSYFPNAPWVNRHAVRQGWDTYAALWSRAKKEITLSWQTESYELNKEIVETIKRFL